MQATPIHGQNQTSATSPDLEQPQRLFQCSTCKRSFTRADHLTRHVRARKYQVKALRLPHLLQRLCPNRSLEETCDESRLRLSKQTPETRNRSRH
ncbi:hypothetical protein DE146DRAFT_436602 [Phaeosphaeria sp. MPI-PUGE-AT-0046c]|nr:hypothetical protein DE146DRAFT_436602 [Phaeosphaeria sp. MPI-PUGE-AT-0046c]